MMKKIIGFSIALMFFLGCEGDGATGSGGAGGGMCDNEYAGQWGRVTNSMYNDGDCSGGFSIESSFDPWVESDANMFINLATDCSFTLSDINCDNYYNAAQTNPDVEVQSGSGVTNAMWYEMGCTGAWSASGTTVSLVHSAYGIAQPAVEYIYNGNNQISLDSQMEMSSSTMCHYYEYEKMEGSVCLFDCPGEYVDLEYNNQHEYCAYLNNYTANCYSDCSAGHIMTITAEMGVCNACSNSEDASSWEYDVNSSAVCVSEEDSDSEISVDCQTCLDNCTSIALASDTPPPNQEQAVIWCQSDSGSSISCYEDCQD